MVSVAVRDVVVAETVIVTTPEPTPFAPLLILIQVTGLDAVQAQLAVEVTPICCVLDVFGTVRDVGETDKLPG